jgi:hypothetical protein
MENLEKEENWERVHTKLEEWKSMEERRTRYIISHRSDCRKDAPVLHAEIRQLLDTIIPRIKNIGDIRQKTAQIEVDTQQHLLGMSSTSNSHATVSMSFKISTPSQGRRSLI